MIPSAYTVDTFTESYIACALWSSSDEDSNPLDEQYDASDLAPETLATMQEDCADFWREQAEDLAAQGTAEQNGHDFWLTRNGHGVGFWDRDTGAVGDRLTEAALTYGTYNLYVGNDGTVDGMRG